MKTLIFESHSTSEDNERGIASGHLNSALSAKGILQAQTLGDRYQGMPIDMIYCSDLDRSRETARIAFGSRGIPIVEDRRLREWDYGQFNGASASEVERLKIRHILDPFPGGESLSEAIGRIADVIDEISVTSPETVLIIGHRAVFYTLEHRFKKLPLEVLVVKPWNWQPSWKYLL